VLLCIDKVNDLLNSNEKVSACVAPSFPAEFPDINYGKLIGMIRALGFDYVHEVAVGADLVAQKYNELINANRNQQYISANCPAIVEYICRYHPNLVKSLAPIVSPMLGTARAIRNLLGEDLKVVFIGPCLAKKKERDPTRPYYEIDAVITFIELRQMFEEKGITPENTSTSDFDDPHGHIGSLFPISRGMLQAARISDDVIQGKVIAADGKRDFIEAIKEYETGDLNVNLLEVLCCKGCIMGPGIKNDLPLFRRRSHVINYVKSHKAGRNLKKWKSYIDKLADLDLSRGYLANNRCFPEPPENNIVSILNRMGKFSTKDELNCGACGYDSCRDHAIAIYKGLAESEMCLPYSIDQLKKTLQELSISNKELANVQEALMHSERLASMGQLAAGIAHEINNPLGIVLMYAHLLLEECEENIRLKKDLEMIVEQTDRCKTIVSGLLNFARQNKVSRQPTNIAELIELSLRTALIPQDVKIVINQKNRDLIIELDSSQMAQVFINLIVNACEAMPDGGILTITVTENEQGFYFIFKDTGVGIAPDNYPRIFEPFFTTKQLGKGTGLGMSVAYGIIKMHGGDIHFESNNDPAKGTCGTIFTVNLPQHLPPI